MSSPHRRRHRRHLRIREVQHVAGCRGPPGAALPRHRRDVPRDDLVDAQRTASTCTTRPPWRRRASEPEIVSGTDPLAPTITVDGTDVAVAIRQDDVNAAVSPVSAVPEVRARLLQLQRDVIAERRRDRRRGPRHRLGRRPGRAREAVPERRPRRPRAAPGRRAGERRPGRDPRVAAGPRPDRLRPRDRTPGHGRRRRAHRHHAVHPRRGHRAGRRRWSRTREPGREEHQAAHLRARRAATGPRRRRGTCCTRCARSRRG